MEAYFLAGFLFIVIGLILLLFFLYYQDHRKHKKLNSDYLILRAKYKMLQYGCSMFRSSKYCKLCSPGGCIVCDQFRELIDNMEELN
jgi:hypothetical protein